MTELLVLNVAQKVMQAVSLDGSRVHTLIDGLDEFPDGVVVDSQRGQNFSLVEGGREGQRGWMFGYCSVMMGSGRR